MKRLELGLDDVGRRADHDTVVDVNDNDDELSVDRFGVHADVR